MFKFLRRYGVGRFTNCVFCRLLFSGLRLVCRFDRWHVVGAYPCREYKRLCVELIEREAPAVLVDVGCGLGEIIARCKTPSARFGFDPDPEAVKAARWLHGGRAEFCTLRPFDAAAVARVTGAPIDLMVMTGWTQGVPLSAIRQFVSELAAEPGLERLLIDTVRLSTETTTSFTTQDLASLGVVETSLDGGDGTRDLHLIRVARPAARP